MIHANPAQPVGQKTPVPTLLPPRLRRAPSSPPLPKPPFQPAPAPPSAPSPIPKESKIPAQKKPSFCSRKARRAVNPKSSFSGDLVSIFIRRGKNSKDRMVPLPQNLKQPLREHLAEVKKQHQQDLQNGFGKVDLPHALDRKYPKASTEFTWQYVFPSATIAPNWITGLEQRHHVSERTLQRAFKRALRRAKIDKHASCHDLRHSFATFLLESGYDIRTI